MDDIQKIKSLLEKYPWDIYTASKRTEDLRETWQLTEARKDYETAKAFLTAKAGNLTEGQAKAKAIESVYETTQAAIMAESSFRRALADQTRVENEFTAMRKMAEMLKITEFHIRNA